MMRQRRGYVSGKKDEGISKDSRENDLTTLIPNPSTTLLVDVQHLVGADGSIGETRQPPPIYEYREFRETLDEHQ